VFSCERRKEVSQQDYIEALILIMGFNGITIHVRFWHFDNVWTNYLDEEVGNLVNLSPKPLLVRIVVMTTPPNISLL